jgi:DNA-binding LacI/PurR family transcriptional regulator/GAF domain-containing protein
MRSDRHPRVGLLLSSVTDARDVLVWSGVLGCAREHGVDLLCLDCGRSLQAGPLCDLAGPEALDGLVIHLHDDEFSPRLTRQSAGPLPLVNLTCLQEGQPGIVGGNYQGMRSLLRHLIEVHGYRHLAFVQGAVGDAAADAARYRAYVDVLSECSLPRPGALVVAEEQANDARADLAERAARHLLDRGGDVPDAIVCCSDAVALGLLEALSRRGLRVPDDIAVTGFDDTVDGQTAWPALTTVAQPWRKMGARALELLLAQLEGDPAPAQMVIPCELVVRESCGCWPRAVVEAGVALPAGLSWPKRHAVLLSQVTEALAGEGIEGHADLARRLVDAFSAEVQARAGEETVFVPTVRSILLDLAPSLASNSVWQMALSLLRRHVLASPDLAANGRDRAEALIEQGRVIVSEAAVRAQAAWADNAVRRTKAIERVGTAISTHFDLGRLSSAAAQELPKLGVSGLYLCLYEEGSTSGQWCRLVAGYTAEGPLELEYGGRRFRLPQLLPAEMLASRGADALLAEPLVSGGQELGYVLFEAGSGEGELCDSLRSKLSSALRSLLLLQQTERDALQLQTAAEVGRAVSSVLDPDELMQAVVDLVLERLDLYYVGLFLVDESGSWTRDPGRWAVLRAGTGQSGRHMLADGHKLEVGGASMVGQCIAQGRARIALDVGKEAVRFDNPLLPHTRSELALPLVSRERLFGAMTIQSVQAGAFGAQDIAALQLMADQMANAIETARLYATTREALQRTQILYETSRTLSATLGEASTMSAVLAGLSQQAGCVYAVLFAVREATGSLELRGGTWQGKQDALPNWLREHCAVAEGGALAEVVASGAMRTVHGWDSHIDRCCYERLGVQHLVRVLAPLRRRDETVGVVEVAYDVAQAGTIDQQDTRWLAAYLDQAAVALENAQLLAQLQQRLRREQVLRQVSDRVRSALDVESVLHTTVAEVSRVLGRPAFIRLDGTTVSVTSPLKESQHDD